MGGLKEGSVNKTMGSQDSQPHRKKLAPHTGHSSQLSSQAALRNDQCPPTVARTAL